MDEVSDIFKRGLEILHKKSSFTKCLQNRSQMHKYKRENIRHNLILQRRKIEPGSLLNSPEIKTTEVNINSQNGSRLSNYSLRSKNVTTKRIDMLAKWKEDKQKLKDAEKVSKKPVFKVGHVSSEIGLPSLSSIGNTRKGKPINKVSFKSPSKNIPNRGSVKENLRNESLTYNFVDVNTDQHAKNEKSIATNANLRRQIDGVNKKNSNTPICYKPENPKKALQNQETNLTKEFTQTRQEVGNENYGYLTETFQIQNKSNTNRGIIKPNLPRKSAGDNITHEKENIKKINITKSSKSPKTSGYDVKGKLDASKKYDFQHVTKRASNTTSPSSENNFFVIKLDNEINRIEAMCQKWLNIRGDPNLPEEAGSFIDVAIGQSKLLLSKKFKQFRDLINIHNKITNKDKLVTSDDLHGFWDMMHIEIEDLDKRFKNLTFLKKNNWQEKTQKINKKRNNKV